MTAVFDSNIIIDFLNGSRQAHEEISAYSKRIVSILAYMEALVGIHDPHRQEIVRQVLHDEFEIVALNDDIVEMAIRIRRETRIKFPDAIIWATARCKNLVLVTRNTKDFPKDDPTIRIPYTLKSH